MQQIVRQRLDGGWEGGREEQVLTAPRQQREHARELVREARVEQAIGFVQHQQGHTGQAECVVIDQIQQAARRGHDDLGPAAQAHHLRIDGHAAEHDGHLHRIGKLPRQAANRFADLGRELARGYHDEGVSSPGCLTHDAFELLQQRQGKCDRLAGTGASRPQHIVARQDKRNGSCLNRSGLGIAAFIHSANERRTQPERGEWIQSRLTFTDLPFTLPAFSPRNALSAMPRSTAT